MCFFPLKSACRNSAPQAFVNRLRRLLGPRIEIEDLWIPYFCVSANLTKRKAHVHDSGPLWQACRASASLPLLIPPTVLPGPDGGTLMDGGLMNNLVRASLSMVRCHAHVYCAARGRGARQDGVRHCHCGGCQHARIAAPHAIHDACQRLESIAGHPVARQLVLQARPLAERCERHLVDGARAALWKCCSTCRRLSTRAHATLARRRPTSTFGPM